MRKVFAFLSVLLLLNFCRAIEVEDEFTEKQTPTNDTSPDLSYPSSPRFTKLTVKNITDHFSKISGQLIMFFTSDTTSCPLCAVAANSLSAVAREFQDTPLQFAYVNCNEEKVICRLFGITSQPTTRFVNSNGAFSDTQAIDVHTITNWINFMRGPAVVSVETEEDLKREVGQVPVYFLEYQPDDTMSAIVFHYAAPFKGRIPFLRTSNKDLAQSVNLTEPNSLVAVREGVPTRFAGVIEESAITRFILAEHIPDLSSLTQKSFRDLATLPDRLLVVGLYANELEPSFEAALRGLCRRDFQESLAPGAPLPRFACAHLEATQWPQFASVYGVSVEQLPAVVILRPAQNEYWVRLGSEVHSWAEDLRPFAESASNGSLKAHKVDFLRGASFGDRIAAKLHLFVAYAQLAFKQRPLLTITVIVLVVGAVILAIILGIKQHRSDAMTDEILHQLEQQGLDGDQPIGEEEAEAESVADLADPAQSESGSDVVEVVENVQE